MSWVMLPERCKQNTLGFPSNASSAGWSYVVWITCFLSPIHGYWDAGLQWNEEHSMSSETIREQAVWVESFHGIVWFFLQLFGLLIKIK